MIQTETSIFHFLHSRSVTQKRPGPVCGVQNRCAAIYMPELPKQSSCFSSIDVGKQEQEQEQEQNSGQKSTRARRWHWRHIHYQYHSETPPGYNQTFWFPPGGVSLCMRLSRIAWIQWTPAVPDKRIEIH